MAKKVKPHALAAAIMGDIAMFTKELSRGCAGTVASRTPVDSSDLVMSFSFELDGKYKPTGGHGFDPESAFLLSMQNLNAELDSMNDGYKYSLKTDTPYAADAHYRDYVKTGRVRFMSLNAPDVAHSAEAAAKKVRK